MSVIQISKIQIRRGKKLDNNSIPQLSSGEFGWAVDTQELFIGNGSIAEGAPFVGNTKILTENDNILELVSSYEFGPSYQTVTGSVLRSLQSKLDEVAVSVKDFGAIGDGIADNADAFETAVSQLFDLADTDLRKVLIVPNGNYKFDRNITLSNGVILRGETQKYAVLNIGEYSIDFDTDRPTDVLIENLTVEHTTGGFVITGLADSEFNNVKFHSNYTLTDDVIDLFASDVKGSVYWENSVGEAGFEKRVTNVTFRNCDFDSVLLGTKTVQKDLYETEIIFQECNFRNCHCGSLIDGVATQKNNWDYRDCKYNEIANQAFIANNGRDTVFNRSIFKNCGNGTATAKYPVTPIVEFAEYQGNELIDCSSNRLQLSDITTDDTKVGVPSTLNANRSIFIDMAYVDISKTNSFKPLAVFGLNAKYNVNPETDLSGQDITVYTSCIKIEYMLRLGVNIRKGILMISVNGDLANVSITDNFTYSSETSTSDEGIRMTQFEFKAELKDNDSDGVSDTIVLSYLNPYDDPIEGEPGDITFSVCYGV